MIYYRYVDKPKEKVFVLEKEYEEEKVKEYAKGVAVVGGGVALGYGIYRFVRFIPSLAPPLWWTIPANAACP